MSTGGTGVRYSPGRLFLIAAVFILLAPVYWQLVELSQGRIAEARENADLYQEIYPRFNYTFRWMRQGVLPLWNPTQHCGTPLQADPRTGMFQPLNAIFLVLPTAKALAAHAFLCLFLMGAFFALFARGLGLGYIASVFGGVVYAFCGASAAAMSRPELAATLAWAPLAFWAVREHAIRQRFGAAVFAGLAVALLVLAGAPALAGAILAALGLYAAYLLVSPPEGTDAHLFRGSGGLLAMIIVAAGVSAVQWLPTARWLPTLANPMEALFSSAVAGYAPKSARDVLAQLITTRAGALPRLAYFGIPTLLVLPSAFVGKATRRDGFFFGGLALAGMVLAVTMAGRDGGYPWVMAFYPAAFGVAALAALGAHNLWTPGRSGAGPAWATALLLLAVAAVVMLLGTMNALGLALTALVFSLIYLVVRWRPLGAICALATLALIAADLAIASTNRYLHPHQDAPQCYRRHGELLQFVEEQALGGRVFVVAHPLDSALPSNLGMVARVHAVGGTGIPLTTEQDRWWSLMFTDATAPSLVNYMAPTVIVVTSTGTPYEGSWGGKAPRLRHVRGGETVEVFVNEDALPRVYWAPRWRLVDGVEGAAMAMLEEGFEPRQTCLVDEDSASLPGLRETVPEAGEDTAPGQALCTVTDVTPNEVVVHVDADAPGMTVLADTFAEGWRATLDGAPWPILRANGLFRGIATPAGAHDIVFRYGPAPFRLGLLVSLITLAVGIVAGVVALFRTG